MVIGFDVVLGACADPDELARQVVERLRSAAAPRAEEWKTGHDPLFGPYRFRIVGDSRDRCHRCGAHLSGVAEERERGGTRWQVHSPECPRPAKAAKGAKK